MKRLNLILGAVLIVQVVLSVYLLWPRTAVRAEKMPLIGDFAADDVVALTITDNEGNHVALSKDDAGWVLPEAGNFPAQADKITPILQKVGELDSSRLVTRTDSSHQRLQVAPDDFNRLLDIEMKGGDHHKLYVGSSGGTSATHVRADEQAEVYLTSNLDPWDVNTQASSWIDTLYFTVPQTATVALDLENANGVLDFTRDGDNWTMAGLGEDEQFNKDAFTTMLSQATTLRMAEPLGNELKPEYGMDTPQAVVTVTTDIDGAASTYTMQVGAKDETGSYVIHASNSPYYVKVTGYTGDNFVQKKRADFITVPATPEAVLPVDLDKALEMVPGAPVSPMVQESPVISGEVPSTEPVTTGTTEVPPSVTSAAVVPAEASPAATSAITATTEAMPATTTAATATEEPSPAAASANTATTEAIPAATSATTATKEPSPAATSATTAPTTARPEPAATVAPTATP